MSRLYAHMRALWPRFTLVPPLPFLLYSALMVYRGTLRWDHIAVAVLVPVLAYTSAATRKLCIALYPMGLIGLFYDLMRLFQNVGVSESTVHLCDLRATEMRFFGIGEGAGRMTVHDWFLDHHALALDLLCAIPYGTFLFAMVAFAMLLYFRDYTMCLRFTWGFFALNIVGFATYHLYPAAPPWYYHLHGCVVDMHAVPSEGPNLMRVDAALGFDYFHAMYTRSSDVFGAVPSLHCAYPTLIAISGWRTLGWKGRTFSVLFASWMCFSAIYLDHHWIVDAVAGLTYCFLVFTFIAFVFRHLTTDHAPGPIAATHASA